MKDCKDIALTLFDCLKETDCVKKEGKDFRDCMLAKDSPECQAFRNTLFECRRGQVDMRTRIRGSKQY